jgi:hypothetical protein
MPAMPAELKLCGVRGVCTEDEVASGLPDRAMLAPFLPPAQSRFRLQRQPHRDYFLNRSRAIWPGRV